MRWKRSTDPSCHLCSSGDAQSNNHVLSNCSSRFDLKRYDKSLRRIIDFCNLAQVDTTKHL